MDFNCTFGIIFKFSLVILLLMGSILFKENWQDAIANIKSLSQSGYYKIDIVEEKPDYEDSLYDVYVNNMNAALGIVFLISVVSFWFYGFIVFYRRSTGLSKTVKANKPMSGGDDGSVEVLFKQNKPEFIEENKSQHLINKVEELEQNFQNSIKAIQCLKDEIDLIKQELRYNEYISLSEEARQSVKPNDNASHFLQMQAAEALKIENLLEISSDICLISTLPEEETADSEEKITNPVCRNVSFTKSVEPLQVKVLKAVSTTSLQTNDNNDNSKTITETTHNENPLLTNYIIEPADLTPEEEPVKVYNSKLTLNKAIKSTIPVPLLNNKKPDTPNSKISLEELSKTQIPERPRNSRNSKRRVKK